MSLSDVAIRRPVFTTMLSLVLLVLGVLGGSRLGTDLYPDVAMPFVMVRTVWPGASPEDIEERVTRPIEDAVAGISGVDRLFSQSREDVSFVMVQFQLKVPNGEASQHVRDKVGSVLRELPDGADPPVVSPFDLGSQPVVVFTAGAGEDPARLREIVDDQVRPRLEQIDGVATVRIEGGAEREIEISLDPDRLRSVGLAPAQIVERLRIEHLDLPGGRFPQADKEVGIRVRGRFKDLDDIRLMPVSTDAGGSHVRLGDVALVREAIAQPRTLVRTNGTNAVSIEVVKQSGKNTIEVAKAARAAMAELEVQLGIQTQILIDQSTQIEANAHEVWIAIYFGGAMAILIILLFLLDLRGTIISATALPTSVIGTLFAMWVLGYSLNQLTLLGLSLAIGLLIDDAVVVRESITRRLERGEDPMTAAAEGTREIALAVLATTLTLVAVFVPVAFMQGLVGQFFRQFGLTISAAVLISLFVAFTLDPMLSARFARAQHGEDGKVVRTIRRGFEALDRAYARSLHGVLAWPKTTVIAAILVFLGSIGLGSQLGTDFIGQEDRGQLIVNIHFPPGTRLHEAAARSAVGAGQVRALPGVVSVYEVVGQGSDPAHVYWRVNLVPKGDREEGAAFYKERLRGLLAAMPQAEASVSDPPQLEGLGDWPPFYMQIVGRELPELRRQATVLAETMRAVPGMADVQIQDRPGKPELSVDIDREESARLGLPGGLVALQVRLLTFGEEVGALRDGRVERPIRVRLASAEREDAADLGRLALNGPLGSVSLSQVASITPAVGPSVIEHEARERQIAVTAQLAPGASLGKVVEALHGKLDGQKLPEGYHLIWNGQQKDMKDMATSIGLALGLAIIFIYMVLASQFESFVHPFTIMLSLPLALVGAVLGLAVTGHTVGMGANIGVILLMGLVTKNAILLVDGALQRIAEGSTPEEAIADAGPRRLRPILMTSAAMVLGMLPTALGQGVGSEFRAPMAIAVIGGVITSTLLTLWVVPVVFLGVERVRATVRRRTHRNS